MGGLITILGILGILGIILLLLIITLIDSIIEKHFCNIIKYRIIEIKEDLSTKYIIQRRFLWFFWINAFDGTCFNSLDFAKHKIKRLKRKNKKEVVYKE